MLVGAYRVETTVFVSRLVLLQDKIKERKEVGMSVLRAAMAYVTLRRRKDMVRDSVNLVERTVRVEAIPFEDGHHKHLHDLLYTSGK